MDATQNSLHLLQHFERDAADTAAPSDVPIGVEPTRGIAWVLKWAAALAVLGVSTTVLTEFAYCVMAEQLLARAARAGVLEATLPRATVHSVEQSVRRRLEKHVADQRSVTLALLHNGALVGKKLQPTHGDHLAIRLAMPAQAVMPAWLRKLSAWRADAVVSARAERSIPGRRLIVRSTP